MATVSITIPDSLLSTLREKAVNDSVRKLADGTLCAQVLCQVVKVPYTEPQRGRAFDTESAEIELAAVKARIALYNKRGQRIPDGLQSDADTLAANIRRAQSAASIPNVVKLT